MTWRVGILLVVIGAGIVGVMFGFTRKRSSITVEFVERGADKPFAVSKVPIGQLPDSFHTSPPRRAISLTKPRRC
jgi:hypothetical protein